MNQNMEGRVPMWNSSLKQVKLDHCLSLFFFPLCCLLYLYWSPRLSLVLGPPNMATTAPTHCQVGLGGSHVCQLSAAQKNWPEQNRAAPLLIHSLILSPSSSYTFCFPRSRWEPGCRHTTGPRRWWGRWHTLIGKLWCWLLQWAEWQIVSLGSLRAQAVAHGFGGWGQWPFSLGNARCSQRKLTEWVGMGVTLLCLTLPGHGQLVSKGGCMGWSVAHRPSVSWTTLCHHPRQVCCPVQVNHCHPHRPKARNGNHSVDLKVDYICTN